MNNDRNKKIEEILNSLDSCPKASVPAYFYTRLMSRMENGVAKDVKKSWILRPAFALSVLAAVILINAAVVLKSDSGNETSTTADVETLQSLAAEYSLNDNSYVYDLNQDK